jgi:hypothetical protein
MVDIAAAREAYHERIISNIGLIRSEFNIADGLTKAGPNEALRKFLVTHCLDHPIEQYVINCPIPSQSILIHLNSTFVLVSKRLFDNNYSHPFHCK